MLLGKIPRLAALARNDMSICGLIQPHRLYPKSGGRQVAAPTVSQAGDTVQPHGLYSECGMAMNHRRYIAYSVRRTGCSGGNLAARHVANTTCVVE